MRHTPALAFLLSVALVSCAEDSSGDGEPPVDSGRLDSSEFDTESPIKWVDPPIERDVITPRRNHVAVLLQDGRVLVFGGLRGFAECEIYDPDQNLGLGDLWVKADSLNVPRSGLIGVSLKDGRVLALGGLEIAGGSQSPTDSRVAEIYDPKEDRWTLVAPMARNSGFVSAVALQDGRALVRSDSHESWTSLPMEIFDPHVESWTQAPGSKMPHLGASMTALDDGSVLFIGGEYRRKPLTDVETYDPNNGTWTACQPIPEPRVCYDALSRTTSSQRIEVWVIGGTDERHRPMDDVFIYDVSTDTWREGNTMSAPRCGGCLSASIEGTIYASGGFKYSIWCGGMHGESTCDVFIEDRWIITQIPGDRTGHTTTVLKDGSILFVGGSRSDLHAPYTTSHRLMMTKL